MLERNRDKIFLIQKRKNICEGDSILIFSKELFPSGSQKNAGKERR